MTLLTAPPAWTTLPDTDRDGTCTHGGAVGTVRAHALEYVTTRHALHAFTRSTYRTRWYLLLRFADHLGNPPIAQVRRPHVEDYLASRPIATSTLRAEFSGLRAFFAWAVELGYRRADPCRGVVGPRKTRSTQRGLTVAEVERVLAHAPDTRTAVGVLLFVQEGLRLSEAARLTTDRIEWDTRTLHVTGKGGHERAVPFSEQTGRAIHAYLAEHPARHGQPLLRSYQHSTRGISPNHLYRTVIACFWQAGVKHAPWDGKCVHALRHTAAHELLERGADIADLALFLGHAHVSTTGEYLRRKRITDRLRVAQAGRHYGPGGLG